MIKPERSELAPDAATAVLHCADGTNLLRIRTAKSFWSRFRGLMLTKPLPQDEALLIPRCSSVHTLFMRYAIDVVYLDRAGCVLKCVEALRPWRASAAFPFRLRGAKPSHCLELAAGTITRLGIAAGDRLEHIEFAAHAHGSRGVEVPAGHGQRGAASVEFVVVGPLLALMGLSVLQFAMMYLAKNQIDHATLMAARAGSTANANVGAIKEAYYRNLIALYGGGVTNDELIKSYGKVVLDAATNVELQLLNPTKESYDDWNDPELEKKYGHRAVRNNSMAFRDHGKVGSASGQNIQDANLIKVRVMHGYEPKVPLVRFVFVKYLQWQDTKTDAKYTALINAGRVPIVAHAALQMQSDPIESAAVVSSPGPGNGGKPVDPGDPPITHEPPPKCGGIGDIDCSGGGDPPPTGEPPCV